MNKIDVINSIAKVIVINFFTFLTCAKMINYKIKELSKYIVIVFSSIITGIICVTLSIISYRIVGILVSYFLCGIILSMIIQRNIQYSIGVTFVALTIVYLMYIISVMLTAVIISVLRINIKTNSLIFLIMVITFQSILLCGLFKQKRFKNGIQFLKDEEKFGNLGIIGIAFVGITILLYSLFNKSREQTFIIYLTCGLSIEAICLFIWIKKKITKYYKQKLKEQTVADLQNEIKEKDNKISEILEENKAIATINHKYSSRIKALEEFSSKIVSKPELVEKMKTEFGEDYTAFAAQIKRISQEYSNEMKTKVTKENAIPKTGIFGIDTLLEHMSTEATKSNISLDVKINASLNYMVENIISESALETLLGDHIKDAIIAINCSNNTNRRILVVISIVDRCYEINFYDTGIEFEIDTLIKLGKEQITTHKETGRKRNRLYDHIWDIKQNKGKLNYRRKVPNE